MGRPIELTDELAIEIAKYLIEGNSIADAAALAGIGERTYHDWIKRGEAGEEPFSQFSQLCRAARADGRRRLVRTLRVAAKKDWHAALAFLARSDPANWGTKSESKVDVTSNGETIQTVIYIPDNGRESTGDPTAAGTAADLPIDIG
jgi:Helix-turn-helix domain